MAPALMEVAATVSHNSGRKVKITNPKILDNISNFTSCREIPEDDVTSCIAKAQEATDCGRTGNLVENESIKPNLETFPDFGGFQCFEMENKNIKKHIESDEKQDNIGDSQSSSGTLQNALATSTCAPEKTDVAEVKPAGGVSISKLPSDAVLKQNAHEVKDKLQSLDLRALSLRRRLRHFQANRLITHSRNQMDYAHNTTDDSRQKSDPQNMNKLSNAADKQTPDSVKLRKSAISANSVQQPLANVLKTTESSSMSTCSKSQATSCGPVSTTPPGTEGISMEEKQEAFGVLASQVESLADFDDPDATDPESDSDDFTEIGGKKIEKLHHHLGKKPVDEIWMRDRVKIGSMCTWIQAQIADLSHKVKRYGDFHQHAKSTRKQLLLEEAKQHAITPLEPQRSFSEDLFAKDDLSNDSAQNNIFAKLQVHKNGLNAQPRSEMKYEKGSGARTIPIAQFPKHKYVKRRKKNDARNVNEFTVCPSLPTPFPCKQCQKLGAAGCRNATGSFSAVYLDHSYHEQLSTKYDIMLPHVLESTLRKDKIFTGKKNLLLATPKELFRDQHDVSGNKQAISKLAATASATASASKMRLDRKRQKRVSKIVTESPEHDDPPQPKKKAVALSAASQLQKRASSLRLPSSGSGESRPSTPITEHSMLSSSYPSPSLPQLLKKKNRTSSEYDINNIVIPYSISSSTRLERPQYKEIPTPGWRPLGRDALQKNNRDQMEEDTSDEAYAQRHSKCEVVEHKRFTSYFQLPIRKSRPSRKSSECNTPEPYSPLHPDHSNSSFGSATTPTEFILATPSSGKINRYGNLASLPLQQEDYKVMCWPQRTFPLVGDYFLELSNERLTRKCPLPEPVKITAPSVPEEAPPKIDTPDGSCSPDSELMSPSQISPDGDSGKMDDSWTVKLLTEEKPTNVEDTGTCRKGIVLKLAKK